MIYTRRATALHAARPAATVAWAGALTLAVIACPHPAGLLALSAAVVAIAFIARVPRPVLIATAIAIPFGLLWVVTNALLVRDGLTVLARLGQMPWLGHVDITLEAVVAGGVLALRGMAALQIGLLLSAVADPDRLLIGLRRAAPRAGLTGALTLRLAPALVDDGRRYADGLRCRADGGALDTRARVLVVSATTGRAIDRASNLASTLELRGIGGGAGKRSAFRSRTRASRHDWTVGTAALALIALTVAGMQAGTLGFATYPQIEAAPAVPAALWGLLVGLVAAAPLASRRGTEPPR